MDGYPDDPWIEELTSEMNGLVKDAERRIANAPLIGSHLLGDILFDRDRLNNAQSIYTNDPYSRLERINLN